MDDEGGDWFAGGDDEPAPVVKPLKKKKKEDKTPAAADQPPEAAEGEAPAPEAGAEKKEVAEDEFLDPDKLLLFKHWIRPKFLPYKYIYDYRKSYYDDVMEVLNSRRKGLRRNIPPAQTWAERLNRARKDPIYKLEAFDRFLDDVKLVTRTQISGNFYEYYSKEQFNRRFSKLLF